VGVALGISVGVNVVGVVVFGFSVGFINITEPRLGLELGSELGFRIGVLVGGLGSHLMHAPLICPPNEPLQHNN
jgi:hypothetical protein